LMLIIGGLCLGCYNAWYWVQKERQELVGNKNQEEKDNV